MASISKTKVGTYTVHWREPGGRIARQRKTTFRLKGDAQAFAYSIESDKSKGQYADPSRGTLTFSEYVGIWMAAQSHRPATVTLYGSDLRNHIVPTFGRRRLADIRRTEVQGWVKSLTAKGLAPRTVKRIHGIVAAVLKAAVADDRMAKSPCVGVTLPEVSKTNPRPRCARSPWIR